MNITSKLTALIEVISTRGVGHTTLLKTGTDNYQSDFIQLGISHAQLDQADLLSNPKAKALTIRDIELGKHKGLDLPVAIDNYIVRELASDALLTIECMSSSLEKKTAVMEELMNLVEYYQDRAHAIEKISFELATTPWWKVAKIIKLEKKIHKLVLEYNEGSNQIDEAFAKILKIVKENK